MKQALNGKIKLLLGATCAVAAISMFGGDRVIGQANNCGMQLNQAPVIFCETFDAPSPNTNRSGQLDGRVWGVSRLAGSGSHWRPATLVGCNGNQAAQPDATDVIICNGKMRQVTHDNGDVTILAAYPKQPFDFNGRTGTVSFDVTNDTSGNHGAWPEFWLTDQPVPAPGVHGGPPCDFCSVPRNALGFRFAADGGDCPGGWRADSAVIVRNYVLEDKGIFDTNPNGMQLRSTGCASRSTGPNGGLNHVEIRISQNLVEVWASNAGTSSPLRKINTITNANLTMTKGLVWIEDGHYNAHKSSIPEQTEHTYTWDNVAFDGPATYRDLSFDVPDRLQPMANGLLNLGWNANVSAPANMNTLPMTTANIQPATGALLMFNYGLYMQVNTFNYTINGHPNSAPSPIPSTYTGWRSVALPVPLNQLQNGPQNIMLSGDKDFFVTNVNIVLVAAEGVPGVGPRPTAPSNLRLMSGLAINHLDNWAGLLRQTFN